MLAIERVGEVLDARQRGVENPSLRVPLPSRCFQLSFRLNLVRDVVSFQEDACRPSSFIENRLVHKVKVALLGRHAVGVDRSERDASAYVRLAGAQDSIQKGEKTLLPRLGDRFSNGAANDLARLSDKLLVSGVAQREFVLGPLQDGNESGRLFEQPPKDGFGSSSLRLEGCHPPLSPSQHGGRNVERPGRSSWTAWGSLLAGIAQSASWAARSAGAGSRIA